MSDLTQEELIDIARNDSDWNVRASAVERICDENVLKDVFRNDSVVMVKIRAVSNINDLYFLTDECRNNPQGHIRYAILNRILDEGLLEGKDLDLLLVHLTLNDPEVAVSETACRNLGCDNQDVFVNVARSARDEAIRCQAASKITDEDVLKDLALNDESRFVRLEAIQNPNMADIDTLTFAIIDDDDKFNRFSAISKIVDADELTNIIYYMPLYPRLAEISESITFSLDDFFMKDLEYALFDYPFVVAANFIQDKSILESFIKDGKYNETIIAETIKNRNFKNQKILHDLIKDDVHPKVILAVADKIDDENPVIEYMNEHLDDTELACKLIFKIRDRDFLYGLIDNENPEIRDCAARRLIGLKYHLFNIAMKYPINEIRIEAIGKITNKYDLVMIAHNADDRDIAVAALNSLVADKLISKYLPHRSIITDSLNEISFRIQLDDLILSEDMEIRKLAISKLNVKEKLDEIIASNEDGELVGAAKARLDTLWQDIRMVSDEDVLRVIADKGDDDIKSAVEAQIEDLKTWRIRISKINDITDIDELKDIANNDYNYYVRCEAEGKLENLLFDVRLDEIGLPENQEKFRQIAIDETYPSEIRKKACSKITDENFNC